MRPKRPEEHVRDTQVSKARRVVLLAAAVAFTWASMSVIGGRAAAQAGTAPPPVAPSDPTAAPIQPLAPPGAPPPPAGAAPAPFTVTEPMAAPPPAVSAPAPAPQPYYHHGWFWGAVGVVALTAIFVIVVAANESGNPKPNTTLGDMRAF